MSKDSINLNIYCRDLFYRTNVAERRWIINLSQLCVKRWARYGICHSLLLGHLVLLISAFVLVYVQNLWLVNQGFEQQFVGKCGKLTSHWSLERQPMIHIETSLYSKSSRFLKCLCRYKFEICHECNDV